MTIQELAKENYYPRADQGQLLSKSWPRTISIQELAKDNYYPRAGQGQLLSKG